MEHAVWWHAACSARHAHPPIHVCTFCPCHDGAFIKCSWLAAQPWSCSCTHCERQYSPQTGHGREVWVAVARPIWASSVVCVLALGACGHQRMARLWIAHGEASPAGRCVAVCSLLVPLLCFVCCVWSWPQRMFVRACFLVCYMCGGVTLRLRHYMCYQHVGHVCRVCCDDFLRCDICVLTV